ncbi:hypothetical protein [Brevibacillus sp. DP1.3A]|uniref:hypothetical protein n=1 Tax=unclassified Brevibacillus TaxID=2684853 RepID=UPI00156B6348|nr:hypothetical protein [Brevibacillus sp. DP1.3A]UED77369.1 hypothetical protein HP399_013150 [Brevibacillus sp. DP1.3A]
MLGTIWINFGLGMLAFLVTLGTAVASNVWLVSLERAGIAFVLFFLAAFPIRWLLATFIQSSTPPMVTDTLEGTSSPLAEGGVILEIGQQLEQEDQTFAPLSINKMERIHPTEDPATVAEVVRRLSDE